MGGCYSSMQANKHAAKKAADNTVVTVQNVQEQQEVVQDNPIPQAEQKVEVFPDEKKQQLIDDSLKVYEDHKAKTQQNQAQAKKILDEQDALIAKKKEEEQLKEQQAKEQDQAKEEVKEEEIKKDEVKVEEVKEEQQADEEQVVEQPVQQEIELPAQLDDVKVEFTVEKQNPGERITLQNQQDVLTDNKNPVNEDYPLGEENEGEKMVCEELIKLEEEGPQQIIDTHPQAQDDAQNNVQNENQIQDAQVADDQVQDNVQPQEEQQQEQQEERDQVDNQDAASN